MYRNILRCISVDVIIELGFTCFVGMESESEFTGKYSVVLSCFSKRNL